MSHHDELWDSAVKEAVEKLPEKVTWLIKFWVSSIRHLRRNVLGMSHCAIDVFNSQRVKFRGTWAIQLPRYLLPTNVKSFTDLYQTVKRLAFIIRPQVEATFIKSKARILSLTERVRDEVSMAQIQPVRDQLESTKAVVSPASNPPTTLPHIRFITHSRNHRFFGRKTIIDEIDGLVAR